MSEQTCYGTSNTKNNLRELSSEEKESQFSPMLSLLARERIYHLIWLSTCCLLVDHEACCESFILIMSNKIIKESSSPIKQYEYVAIAKETSLQDLPDVIRDVILDMLSIQEVLKLRSASKSVGGWIEGYTKFRRRLSGTTITFKSLEDVHRFTKNVTRLPFTSFQLKEKVPLEKSRKLCLFLKNYRDNIASLKLHTFGLCVSDFEYKSLESLTSLKKLYIEEIPRQPPNTICTIPRKCFNNLESFGYGSSYKHAYPHLVLKYCTNLKHLCLGDVQFVNVNVDNGEDLTEFLVQKKLQLTANGRLQNFVIEFGPLSQGIQHLTPSYRLLEFFKQIADLKGKVHLINLQASMLWYLKPDPPYFTTEDINNFLFSIKSVAGINDRLLHFKFPSLETLRLNEFSEYHEFMSDWGSHEERKTDSWPKLKSVEGVMDTGRIRYDEELEAVGDDRSSSFKFYEILFESNRLSITNLNLDLNLSDPSARSVESIYLLRNFAANFPNLKKLRLRSETFRSFDYVHTVTLLGQHTRIEDLTLVFCNGISDKCFFGEFWMEPELLTLTHLKQLKLEIEKGQVETFTSAAFANVFALMPLLSFEIQDFTRHQPSSKMNICYVAFDALLRNKFGETIRSFKFNTGNLKIRRPSRMWNCLKRLRQRCILNRRYLQPNL